MDGISHELDAKLYPIRIPWYTTIEIAMNEDLSSIIELALRYASPLPVSAEQKNALVGSEVISSIPQQDVCINSNIVEEGECPADWEHVVRAPEHTTPLSEPVLTQLSGSSNAVSYGFCALPTNPINPIVTSTHTFSNSQSTQGNAFQQSLCCVDVGNLVKASEVPHLRRNSEQHEISILDVNTEAFVHDELVDSNLTYIGLMTSQTEQHPVHAHTASSDFHDISEVSNISLQLESDSSRCCTPIASTSATECSSVDNVTHKVKRKRRREKNPDPAPEPILPPCNICDEKSSGFHYGANTCEACKGFFRRTQKKKEVDYKCKCNPDEQDEWKRGPFRNGCPACRYERCLTVGMSKNAIKIGRYTLNHKTKNINEVKSVEAIDNIINAVVTHTMFGNSPSSVSSVEVSVSSSEDIASPSMVDVTDLLIGSSTSADISPPMKKTKLASLSNRILHNTVITLKEIDTVVKVLTEAQTSMPLDDTFRTPIETIKRKQTECLENYKLKTELFGSMSNMSKEEFIDFYKVTGIDIDGRIENMQGALKFFEDKIALVVAFAKAIPGFRKLSLDDQANLIKASRVENTLIGGYRTMLINIDRERQVVATPWGTVLHMDEIGKLIPIEVIMKKFQSAQQIESLNLSTQEESVLRAIVTMFSDRCALKEPRKVDAIQEKLLTCLQHLLHIRPGGPGTLLYRIFSLLTNLRELTDKENDMAKMLLVDWTMLSTNNYLLLKEFLT